MKRLRVILDKTLEGLIAGLMVLLVIDVLWQVITRYLFKNPSSFTDELAGYLLIWVGFLGAALVAGRKMHLAIDILTSKFKNVRFQRLTDHFIQAMVLLFALGVMIFGGGRLMYVTLTLEQTSASLNLPLGLVYAVLPLSGLFILLYSLIDIFAPQTDAVS